MLANLSPRRLVPFGPADKLTAEISPTRGNMPRDEALQGFVAVWRVMPQKNAIASGCGAGGMGGVVWYGMSCPLEAQKCRVTSTGSIIRNSYSIIDMNTLINGPE